jgi:predicted PurR-regulated permease PerM
MSQAGHNPFQLSAGEKDMPENQRMPVIVPTVSKPAKSLAVRLATIARAMVILAVLAVLSACYLGKEFLTPVLLAFLMALLFSPFVTAIERLRAPRMLAAAVTVLLAIGIAAGAIVSLAQPAKEWVGKAPTALQSVSQRFKDFTRPVQQAQKATENLATLAQPPSADVQQVVVKDQSSILSGIVLNMPRVLEQIAIVVLLLFFFLSSGDNFLRRMVEIAPGLTEKRIVVSIARDIQREMSRYLVTITLINFGLGVATAIALMALQLSNALLWGAMVFVLNFAPYVGASISAVVLAIVGFSTFDNTGHAFAIPGAFLLLAFIEGQLVTPTVLGRRLALNPVVVFVWLLLWGWLWGIIGILLAGPMLACFRIICQHTEALRPIYVLIGEARFEEAAGNGKQNQNTVENSTN